MMNVDMYELGGSTVSYVQGIVFFSSFEVDASELLLLWYIPCEEA